MPLSQCRLQRTERLKNELDFELTKDGTFHITVTVPEGADYEKVGSSVQTQKPCI